ncbi:MAG: methyltransferase domain-containing protein [Rhodobacteraceae bacterium]|nr:methyltransferase domain-containing protein [Paracoccaceae bacterium]
MHAPNILGRGFAADQNAGLPFRGTGLRCRRAGRSTRPSRGLDPNAQMLAVARRKSSAIVWQSGRAEALPFDDDSFDTVVAAYVVTAVPDYRTVVSEMIRVCRPGGRIIMLNHFSNGNKSDCSCGKSDLPADQAPGLADGSVAQYRVGRDVAPHRSESTREPITALGLGGVHQR